MRKVLTIVLSFVLYPKPISQKYLLGGLAVLVSLVATHELQRRKGGDVKASDAHVPAGGPAEALLAEKKGRGMGRGAGAAVAESDTEA